MLILDKDTLNSLDEVDAAFVAYLTLYNKPYDTLEEYNYRKSWFAKTVKIINDQ